MFRWQGGDLVRTTAVIILLDCWMVKRNIAYVSYVFSLPAYGIFTTYGTVHEFWTIKSSSCNSQVRQDGARQVARQVAGCLYFVCHVNPNIALSFVQEKSLICFSMMLKEIALWMLYRQGMWRCCRCSYGYDQLTHMNSYVSLASSHIKHHKDFLLRSLTPSTIGESKEVGWHQWWILFWHQSILCHHRQIHMKLGGGLWRLGDHLMGSFNNVLLNQKLKATKSGTPKVAGVVCLFSWPFTCRHTAMDVMKIHISSMWIKSQVMHW